MARRVITLDEKIRKAEAAVATSKAKYDDALDELKKLVVGEKVLDAYHAGDKTADEIVEFILGEEPEED